MDFGFLVTICFDVFLVGVVVGIGIGYLVTRRKVKQRDQLLEELQKKCNTALSNEAMIKDVFGRQKEENKRLKVALYSDPVKKEQWEVAEKGKL